MKFDNNGIKINILENGMDFILSAAEYIIENDDKYSIKYDILIIWCRVNIQKYTFI